SRDRGDVTPFRRTGTWSWWSGPPATAWRSNPAVPEHLLSSRGPTGRSTTPDGVPGEPDGPLHRPARPRGRKDGPRTIGPNPPTTTHRFRGWSADPPPARTPPDPSRPGAVAANPRGKPPSGRPDGTVGPPTHEAWRRPSGSGFPVPRSSSRSGTRPAAPTAERR